MIAYKDSVKEIEDIKDEILYASNQLDKSKNAKRYKKDKYYFLLNNHAYFTILCNYT